MQFDFTLGKPIDIVAIELLQACQPPHKPYYFGNSGGIDSAICESLLRRANCNFAGHYNVSPIDPPQTREHLKRYYPDTVWDYNARGFFQLIMSQGLPWFNQRWCCRYIKECGGVGEVKVLGMRAQESKVRKEYRCLMPHKDGKTMWILPIVRWTERDRLQYVAEFNLPANPLYKLGFHRTGCVLCPNQTKHDVKLSLKYFPKIVNYWKLATQRYWEIRRERGTPLTQETWQELWDKWIAR